jgi:hypothetical protein
MVCTAGVHGQIVGGVVVDATDDAVYWIDEREGTMQRRVRPDGAIDTIGAWGGRVRGMRVAHGFVYWTNHDERTLQRVPVGGGAPEVLATFDESPGELEVIGDLVYVQLGDGDIAWWRGPDEQGVVDVSDHALGFSAEPGTLVVGTKHGVGRIGSPGAGLQRVHSTEGMVDAVTSTASAIYWTENGRVYRRTDRGVDDIAPALDRYQAIAAVDGGVLIPASNVVYFVADDSTELVPVGVAAAEIQTLAVRFPSVFVTTTLGVVEELCVDVATPVALAPPAPCPVASCSWYASGAVSWAVLDDGEVYEESYYSDGTRSGEYRSGDRTTLYFVDGTVATEPIWPGPAPDGIPAPP